MQRPAARRGGWSPRPDPRAFTPLALPGCALWLRADLGVTLDGSNNVSAWADKSGSGNDVSQGTAASRPAFTTSDANFGNCPTLAFAGSQSLTNTSASLNLATSLTIIVVGLETTLSTCRIVVKGQSGVAYDFGVSTSVFAGGDVCIDYNDVDINSPSGQISASSPFAIATIQGPSQQTIYVNASGAPVLNGSASHQMQSSATPFAIGRDPSGIDAMHGSVAELILYARALSSQEVSAVFRYLGNRYGKAWG